MKIKTIFPVLMALVAAAGCEEAARQSLEDLNMPIVQTKYTADPSPMIYKDTLYLYTSHDEDDGENFHMKDWLLYITTDMVNWQDRGAVAGLKNFKWYRNTNGAWAQQVVERDGKFYMYCPIHGNGISVLVSDSPYGPFVDPLGGTLVWQREHWYDIDPTVWIDDDGQAYMYWGNPKLYYVRLNEDMISYSGDIVEMPHIEDYQEGPWMYKRDDHYYLAFASTCCPEGIGYAMSDSPVGPWEYKGHIMDHTHRTRGNHPGIIDYKGKTYCFGQNYDVFRMEESRHAERRSVSVAEMKYNEDGTIQELPYFIDCKVEQIEWFDPYKKVQAETMAWGFGLKTIPKNEWGKDRWNQLVTNIDDGEYIKVRGVDFGSGARSFTVSASALLYGGTLEIRLDDYDGKLVGKVDIGCTKNEFVEFTTKVRGAKGVHDLCLVFKAGRYQKRNLFQLDWWRMEQ